MELPAFYFFVFQVDKNGNMYYCINQIIQIDINIYRAGSDRKTTGKEDGNGMEFGFRQADLRTDTGKDPAADRIRESILTRCRKHCLSWKEAALS